MSAPRTTSSVIIGVVWFCALLAAGHAVVEKASAPITTRPPSDASEPPTLREHVARRSLGTNDHWAAQLTAPPASLAYDDRSTPPLPAPAAPPSVRPVGQPESSADPDRIADSEAVPAVPRQEHPASARPAGSVPQAGLRLPEPLIIEVVPPLSAIVGESAPFTIRVQNPGATAAHGVAATVEFTDAWELPGSDEMFAEQRLGVLGAGTVRELSLSLTPRTAGRHSVDFRITSETHPALSTTTTAEVRPQLVQLRLAGPDRRWAHQRAEYLVALVNVSGHDLPDARVDVAYDPAVLTIREASTGVVSGRGTLAWQLGTLLRDERVLIQFEFECAAETFRTPLTCDFITSHTAGPQRRLALEVLPPPLVDVAIVDPDDPWLVNGEARFLITVRNKSAAAIDDLQLRFTTSPHFEQLSVALEAAATHATGVADGYGTDVRVEGLAAHAEVRYVATARAVLPGDGLLRVLVRTSATAAPFEVEESAVVMPAE